MLDNRSSKKIISYNFFIINLASKTNIQRLQVLQNISIKSIYHHVFDYQSEIFYNFLEEIKLDTTKLRLKKTFYQIHKKLFHSQKHLDNKFFERIQ